MSSLLCIGRLAPRPLPLALLCCPPSALHRKVAAKASASPQLSTAKCRSSPVPGRRQWRCSSSKSRPTSTKPPRGSTTMNLGTRRRRDDEPEPEPKPKPEPSLDGGAALHEDVYTIPNFLTLTRLVAAPAVGYLVLHDAPAWAVGLLAYAAVTDLLDGWIARRWDRKTVVGTVLDPMADKALITVLTVCLAVKGALPVWVAAIILGRDVGLGIAAVHYRWISLPPPKTFFRYWDFSLPSAEVRPTTISKYNTLLQLALVGLTTAAPLIDADMTSLLTVMQCVVAATTVWSGASYVFSKDAVKILKKK